MIFKYASAEDPLAVTLVNEAAEAAVSIIDRLLAAGAPTVSLIGGLAEPLLSWLPRSAMRLHNAAAKRPR